MPYQKWGKNVSNKHEDTSLLVVKDHHLLRGLRINTLEKLGSKELYSLLLIVVISAIDHQPTSQKYNYNLFRHIELSWKEIYFTAHKVIANSHLCRFNYKIFKNMPSLNKKLFQFDKTQATLFFLSYWSRNNTLCFS